MNDFLKTIVYGGLFAIPFLTLYVANDYFFPYITGKNFAFRIIVEIVFAAWAVLMLLDARYRPRFSWVLSTFSVLLIVMFFANLLGKHPQSSFWSNFERMDGYITLVHLYLYIVVLGSVITTKKVWNHYLNASLLAAFITAFYGIAQFTGTVPGAEGRRIESFLGNSSYVGIYMLFHIFLAFWMFVESRATMARVIYSLLAVMFTYTLIETGTRGTAIGMAVGVAVMATYIMIFGAKYKEFRRYATGVFVLLVLAISFFVIGKDTALVQNNPNLARVANIDLQRDLEVRGTIWAMAWEGVKERPILGYGQSNFNYVFNAKYEPFMFNQEQWFDRSHNVIFDWLIAGGFLGLFAYLSVFGACIYYLFVVPLIKKDDETFTVLERGVLLGILAGYMTHNLVVFDNIVSYIFFGLILALIHSRVSVVMPSIEKFKVDKSLMNQFVAPAIGVLALAIIYTVNVPSMRAATDIIKGYQAPTPQGKLEAFKTAVSRDSFAQQEITEQIAQQAMTMARDEKIDQQVRQDFVALAETELKRLVVDKPDDARIHVFFGSFYRALGEFDAAAAQMAIARELSPNKQSIIAQQAVVAYNQGDITKSRDWFAEALALDERNSEAREYYASMLFLNGEQAEGRALAFDEEQMIKFSKNDFLINAINQSGDFNFMIELYKIKVANEPEQEQNWASLAFLYNQIGEKELAVSTLREAGEKKPSFAKTANCLADNITSGAADPQAGCE
jgi:O-antigen ligase/cytochrome c-type biogenesis protein CcmH/NrfG